MVSPLYSGARILENSSSVLNSTIETLDLATRDTARLNKILRTGKLFGLVPQKDVESAKEAMEAGAHPQIQYLLEKIEKEVLNMRRKQNVLERTQHLKKANLNSLSHGMPRPTHSPDPFKIGRLKFLQQKRKRLEQVLADHRRKQNPIWTSRNPAV